MLVVVDLHRPRVDVRLERVERVREVGDGVRHRFLLRSLRTTQGYAPAGPVPLHRGAPCRRSRRSRPARSTPAPAAVGHLPRVGRGALPPLPGLRREAERDPRGTRGRRPREGQPGVLGGSRAEGRPVVRDRRDQEPRALLRAPRRTGRRSRRRVPRRSSSATSGRSRRGGRTSRRRESPGRGWAWTAYDWDERRLFNYIGDAQNTFPVWNATPLVALDVYEHAYFLDYQTDRASYIDAFLENLDWDVVNGWISTYAHRRRLIRRSAGPRRP